MRSSSILLTSCLLALSSGCASLMAPPASPLVLQQLTCEYLVNPLGIDVREPRLSWVLTTANEALRGQEQTAYRVLVATSRERLAADDGDLWDSGRVASDRTLHITYAGRELVSRMDCYWKARVWDEREHASAWSEPATWSMGLLDPADWQARWIGAPGCGDSPWLRQVFTLDAAPVDARAYVASLGYHELFVNGTRIGDQVLSPSVSDLGRHARYLTYDLTKSLHAGANAVAFWLGAGWARFERFAQPNRPLVIAQLEVTLADGRRVSLASDATWRVHQSPRSLLGEWKFSDYGGERHDARLEIARWNEVECDDAAWPAAATFDPHVSLTAEMIEPNRITATLPAIAILPRTDGACRIDFGRSFTGWFEIPLVGAPGSTVSIDIAERADQDCTYGQHSEYVLGASGRGTFRHRFNYCAGRWVTVRGVTQPPEASGVRAFLVRSAYAARTRFACSSELLTRIHDVTAWTFECLSLGGYTVDCPHRERWGYGGDAHATMATALTHFGMGAFYTKWLGDWRDVQQPDGDVPYTAPTYEGGGGPAWSGVVVALPWQLYLTYGDERVLATMYPTMTRWVSFLATRTHDHILDRYGHEDWGFLGDWVPPGRGQGRDSRVSELATHFFNNCYYLMTMRTLARIAEVLGKHDDAARFARAADAIRDAVRARFRAASTGAWACEEQPYLALVLLAGLAAEDERAVILAKLEQAIAAKGDHLDSGIHGTYFLLAALGNEHRDDLIARMVSQTTYPSWGHMLAQGATTMWEQWDGEHSHLHSSFLSVGAWFVQGIAGIRVDSAAPGYAHFDVWPTLPRAVTWATTSFDSPRGTIECHAQVIASTLQIEVVVPPNTSATIHLPATDASAVTEGGVPLARASGVTTLTATRGRIPCRVGSGRYVFSMASGNDAGIEAGPDPDLRARGAPPGVQQRAGSSRGVRMVFGRLVIGIQRDGGTRRSEELQVLRPGAAILLHQHQCDLAGVLAHGQDELIADDELELAEADLERARGDGSLQNVVQSGVDQRQVLRHRARLTQLQRIDLRIQAVVRLIHVDQAAHPAAVERHVPGSRCRCRLHERADGHQHHANEGRLVSHGRLLSVQETHGFSIRLLQLPGLPCKPKTERLGRSWAPAHRRASGNLRTDSEMLAGGDRQSLQSRGIAHAGARVRPRSCAVHGAPSSQSTAAWCSSAWLEADSVSAPAAAIAR
ncbi:MAG: family 78 glycoside hydrolase catalytic domain [Planctomycetota bacterium]